MSGADHPLWTGGSKAKYMRVEADPIKRLRRRVSNQIWWALHGRKDRRSWESLVGYSLPELKDHLERQFLPGMNWLNYGQWHIDHIVPASSFKFSAYSDPEFRACFALTNLRPLWARDNISKGAARHYLI